MVFSSVPVYLDPPNWHQANNQLSGSTNNTTTNEQNPGQLPQPLPPPATGNAGSIRPTSMADRARMAKLPQPETALKCPRCDSTNTKFCYFNNYSLTQPRHFCKTCRRYWTRGGALRNVPVGGGCRRNKRSKGSSSSSNSNSSSKSPVAGNHERHQAAGCSSTSSSIPSSSCNSAGDHMLLGHITHHPMPQSHLPFMASLHHHLTDHHHYGAAHDQMGLSFCGIQQTSGGSGKSSHHDLDFQMGISTSSGGGSSNVLSSGAHEQWRLQQQVQQFPFLAGLEPPPGLYPFDQEGVEPGGGYGGGGMVGQIRVNKQPTSSMPILHGSLQGAVKMEENQGLNLPIRPFLGINPGSDQFLGGNAWTDLSGFTSSSTSNLL